MTPLEQLQSLIKGWGGLLELKDQDEYDQETYEPGWSEAPFTNYNLAINPERRLIWFTDPSVVEIGALIHEAGHLFATLDQPSLSDEWSFFGWEFCLAQQLGVVPEWIRSHRDYYLESGDDFGDLSEDQQSEVLEERVMVAIAQNLVSEEGLPLSLR